MNGVTALMKATRNRNTPIVEMLIKNKVDINAKTTQGTTALMMASTLPIAEMLVKAGANINAKDIVEVHDSFNDRCSNSK